MFARYQEYVTRTRHVAVLRVSSSRWMYGNAPGRGLIERANEDLDAGCSAAAISGTAVVRVVEGLSLTFVPLFAAGDQTVEAVLATAQPLEHLPRILHDLHAGGRNFAQVVHLVPQIVFTARPNGTIDFVSRRWLDAVGSTTAGDVHGRFFEAISEDDRDGARGRWLSNVALEAPFTQRFRLRERFDVRWYELSATPWLSAERVVKWVATLSDVNDAVVAADALRRSQRRLQLLADVATALSCTTDVADISEAVAPLLAEWAGAMAVIELTVDDTRAAYAASPAEGRLLAERISSALHTGHGRRALRASDDLFVWQISAPRLGGFVAFSGTRIHTDPADEALVRDVSERIADAAERVLSAQRERRVSEVLQRAMLPLTLPTVPGIRFDVAYRAADTKSLVGGDWYDAFLLPDGRVAISIGDVAGHGLDAAIVMGRTRQTMRSSALSDPNPARVLHYASAVADLERSPFVTAFFGVLDPLTLDLEYASAGHPPPLLVDDAGPRPLAIDGPPLGVEAFDGSRVTHQARLSSGGALVLYTDGVVETTQQYLDGENRLVDLVGAWATCGYEQSADDLQAMVLGRRQQHDDAAIFVVRALLPEDIDVTIRATTHDAHRVRRLIQRFVDGHDVPAELAGDIVLASCEAVNNAAEHAYRGEPGTVRVEARRGTGEIMVLVTDAGNWRPEAVTNDAERGRGLSIMRALSGSLQVLRSTPGTTVILRFAVPSPAVMPQALSG